MEAHPGWVNQFSLLTASFHLKTELGSPLSFLSSTKYFFFSQCCYLIRGSFLAWPDLIYESLFSGQSPICQSSFYTLELRAEWHVLGVCHGANGCRKLPSSPPAALFQGLSVSVCRNLSWSQVKKAKISTSGVKYNGVIAADTPVRSRPLSPPLSLPRCFLLPPRPSLLLLLLPLLTSLSCSSSSSSSSSLSLSNLFVLSSILYIIDFTGSWSPE